MENLPEKLIKNNYEYILEERSNDAAIYRQCIIGGEVIVSYEVFLIRVQEAKTSEIAGNVIEYKHKELFPKDEDFGKTAWSVNNYEKAMKIFHGLVNRNKKIPVL